MSTTRKTFGMLLCALFLPLLAFAQNIDLKGSVKDASGEPIPGAYVAVANSSDGTVTDIDGKYFLSVPTNATLEVSFMGYVTESVPVNGRANIDIVLREDSEALEATIVIGYGTARKSDITGSIASVGGNDLREIPANDISYALQGRVAGVEMTQTSSKPGASMQIRIRGSRSLSASNDPLIVLDGIPFMGSLSDISTNDIKSMDILKDAASTAIYGSRGSNGVILITTYKGNEEQDPTVSFNAYASFKKAIKYKMMPGPKFVEMRKMAGIYTNSIDEDDSMDTDWQDMFYRTGVTQNYDVNVTGGTKGGSYRFGTSFFQDQAVVPTQKYKRIALNGSVDQKIGKWFKVGFATNTNYNTNAGNQVDMYAVLSKSPLVNPYKEDGSLKTRIEMPNDNGQYIFTRDVIEQLTKDGKYVSDSNSLGTYNNGYILFNFPWISGLSYKASIGLNYRKTTSGSFTGEGVNAPSDDSPNSASRSYSETKNWTIENLLTYDRTFGKHKVNAVALYSAEQTTSSGQSISGKNIPNEQFKYFNIGSCLASDITVNQGSYTQTGLTSWMGRVMYSFDDRYMLSAAIRSDASSRLAKGHQWHTYPAVSVGWNIHKEKFMQKSSGWLDELKLRVGYGETSNQAVGAYSTLGRLNTSVYNFGDEKYATGYYVSTLPNSDLGWEYSTTWNFGLDYNLFKGRLSGTVEYYVVNTHDILLSLGLPGTTGVGSTTANIGATRNNGIEFTINGTIIENHDWRWTLGLNVYSNKNRLVSLADGTEKDTGNSWFVGYPINCLYNYERDGLWQEGDPYMDILEPSGVNADGYKGSLGMIKVKYHGDYNEDGTPVRAINADDRVPINTDPKFQGGFNTNLSFRNWDLSVIGAFQSGGVLVSALPTEVSYLNMLTGRRGQIDVDYWTPTNTNARYPRPGSTRSGDNPKYASLLGYYSGSFVKIRTITLGYNFHKIPALKKAGIDRLRIYGTVQNPFVIYSKFTNETGLDPEPNSESGNTAYGRPTPGRISYIGFNTPNTHNFLIGVNLTF